MVKKIFERYINTILKDKERKTIPVMISEMLKFSFSKNASPAAYFTRLLYKKNCKNYLDYTSNTTVYTLQKKLNDPAFIPILQNKYLYNLFFKEHDIQIPYSIAYNIGKIFFIGNKRYVVNDTNDFLKFLHRTFDRCKKNKILFFKELAGAWGKGAHKISLKDLESDKISLESLYRDIVSANFIIQEAIIQNEAISRLYPLSVNSIRMDTYVDKEGNTEILSALLRMGGNGNFVDNVTAGGLFIDIDLESGKLGKQAHVFLKNGAKSHFQHPDTGVVFENYTIPFFEEAKTLTLKAAEKLPALRLVGWDVVISDEGPLLLEGNHVYHVGMSEMAYGGYYRNPVFRKVLREAGMLDKKRYCR